MEQNKLESLIKKIIDDNILLLDYADIEEIRKNSQKVEAIELVERHADMKKKAQAAIEKILLENEGYSLSSCLVSFDMREDNVMSTEEVRNLFDMDVLISCPRFKRGFKLNNDLEPGYMHVIFLLGLNKN